MGEAEKWWKSIAGQPRGQALADFEALSEALERRFIPRSVYEKAVKEWNSLKQTGSVEEYMRKVDELATIHPLEEVAEFWHAWEGMRPEIKAEVQFRLEEQGRKTCSREELWSLMWHAETRYPLRQPCIFIPRQKAKSIPARSANTVSSTPTYWICDAQGHRAFNCPKRLASGCPRCGSKAHNLVACPQHPDLRKSEAKAAGGKPATKGGKQKK